jgi:penicillin-binding protein 1A
MAIRGVGLLKLLKLLGYGFVALLLVGLLAGGGGLYVLHQYSRGLPEYRQLADYQPPIVTRVHAADGRLLAEYARENRVFVPVEAVPNRVIQAFLAAEDKNFYSHPGVDPLSILRAALTNLERLWNDRRPVGASTITQQVAKNFLLTNEVSLERKIKEALLAFRIEQAFTKDEILELYLNEIFLGQGSYGVATASLNYFDKSLDELTTAEAAFLAGLPKAPSTYNPTRAPSVAKGRRDWVITRMLENGWIRQEEAQAAWDEPLVVRRRAPTEIVQADYFTEEVRRELAARYGERALYEGGLSVRTTIDPELQRHAERALRDGLVDFDRRRGWRGPETRIELGAEWPAELRQIERSRRIAGWRLAVALDVVADGVTIGFADGDQAWLPLQDMAWARATLDGGGLGPTVERADQVVAPGDVIWVEAIEAAPEGDDGAAALRYVLRQAPEIEGAIVALNPHTGRVLAMNGGFSHGRSEYNRATQALRQPGSALKPFVYLAALENGFTPSSILLDAPLVVDQGPGLAKWKPSNYTRRFYGPSTLRLGVEMSRNLMTVRLAQAVGMDRVLDVAGRFGIDRGMGTNLASSLGAGEVDLLRLTTAYAMLVNGGKRIQPALIERIQDHHGKTVAQRDHRPCPECREIAWQGQPAPLLVDDRERVVDPAQAYQLVNILQGVVERGTGRRALAIGKPLGGKTGTSNDSRDVWFVGFTPDLVVGVFMGFDQPRSLGARETGSSAALPIFVDFMTAALADQPATPFRIPPGVRLVRVDAETGLLPGPGTTNVILEAFLPGTEPTRISEGREAVQLDEPFEDGLSNGPSAPAPRVPQAGGLY